MMQVTENIFCVGSLLFSSRAAVARSGNKQETISINLLLASCLLLAQQIVGPDKLRSTLLRNVGEILQFYTASYPLNISGALYDYGS
jgi:hypothetical protein